MFALVCSWTTLSTVVPKNSLLPVWSPCVCVLMMVVTGLLVTVLILSRITWPHPASFVSTTTTPLAVMNTAVLPPLNDSRGAGVEPVMMYRLSLTFWMCVAASAAGVGPFWGGAW